MRGMGKITAIVIGFVLLVVPSVYALPITHGSKAFVGGIDDQWREQTMSLAEQYKMFGQFGYDNGMLTGNFVKLKINETTGMVTDYTVKKPFGDVVVFISIAMQLFSPFEVHGGSQEASYIFTSTNMRIVINNNPTGTIMHKTLYGSNTIHYILGVGMNAVEDGNSIYISGNGLRGRLWLSGTGSISIIGGDIQVNLDKESQVIFRAMLARGEGVAGDWNQMEIVDAMSNGKIISEDFVFGDGYGVVEDVIAYQEISMSCSYLNQKTLKIIVSADFQEGKVVVVNIYQNTLPISRETDIIVQFDGRKISSVDSVEELIDLVGSEAKYCIFFGGNGIVFLIYIPHFSTHTITIGEFIEPIFNKIDTMGLTTIGASIAITIIAASVMFKKEKEDW